MLLGARQHAVPHVQCQENVAKRPPDPFFVLVQNLGLDGWQIDQVLTRSATQTQILYQKKKTTRPNEIGWVLGLPAVLICVVGLGQFAATQADHSNFVPEEKKDQGVILPHSPDMPPLSEEESAEEREWAHAGTQG